MTNLLKFSIHISFIWLNIEKIYVAPFTIQITSQKKGSNDYFMMNTALMKDCVVRWFHICKKQELR